MGGGAEFQARVAAWACAHMLAEEDVEPPFGLTSRVSVVGCESTDPVDDVLVETVSGHSAFIQAKTRVTLQKARRDTKGRLNSLPSAIHQFVGLYLKRAREESKELAGALDPAHDRFVLAVSQGCPGTVRDVLARVIAGLRLQPDSGTLLPDTLSQAELEAISVFLDHAKESWEELSSSSPTDGELQAFLRLVRVETVPVGSGEPGEAMALTLLRQSLEEKGQARQAWNTLLDIGHRLIAGRSSVAAFGLRLELTQSGMVLRAPSSFRADIERLRRRSEAVMERLSDFARIPLGSERIRLHRPYCEALRNAAEGGGVLLVGGPGAGKSGVLFEFTESLKEAGRDFLVFSAQDLPFSSLEELRRLLQLDHDLVDVLENWPGSNSAFLVVDALDAARTESTASALRALMAEVGRRVERWTVVASIREYDARYGRGLRNLFSGTAPDGPCPSLSGPGFSNVRHLAVGPLTQKELAQLSDQSTTLHSLVANAPPVFSSLLRNPFNLRLASELLGAGIKLETLRGVESQIALLDLYWDERVVGAGEAREADAREAVLRKSVQGMVENRSLRVDRDVAAADPASSPALADLLSSQALIEWSPAPGGPPDESTLTFSHHVLFDYAVSRLLFRKNAKRLAKLLASDPAIVLLARPSLVMHFHHLWGFEPRGSVHGEFWQAVLAVAEEPEIPEIGKLIGPAVAGERMEDVEELSTLLDSFDSDEVTLRAAEENAIGHLVRSALTVEGPPVMADGQKASVWCAFAERLTKNLTDGIAYSVRPLLLELTSGYETFGLEERRAVGVGSRRLLEYAWSKSPRDRNLVIHGLQCVGRSFSSEPAESSALLRTALEPAHVERFGSEELRWIADQVPHLAERDSDFVHDLYVAAFGYVETSNDPSPMGGIVLPLVSNRRQDYQGALYALKRVFPSFLSTAPEAAVSAMNAALEAHVARERARGEDNGEDTFLFDGMEARFLPDGSYIWDRGHAYPAERAVELLDHLERHLESLAEPDRDPVEFKKVLGFVVKSSKLAAVWRRLMRLGSRHPKTLGLSIRSLTWALPILRSGDTSAVAGDLIREIAPHLSQEDRARIEKAVLALPEGSPEHLRKYVVRDRDRLLGCLEGTELVTEAARALLAELQTRDAIPPNKGTEPAVEVFRGSYGEAEHLADLGVPVEEEANRSLRAMEVPVATFAADHLNTTPEKEAVSEVFPHLQALKASLDSAESDGVHPKQADYAWGVLAAACASIAKVPGLEAMEGVGALVRSILLEAGKHRDPGPDPDTDRNFIQPHWGKPAARIDGASGLAALARNVAFLDQELIETLEALLVDPVPAVRFQVAIRFLSLYEEEPTLVWTILDRIVPEEESPGVILGFLQGPLDGLRFVDPDRVASMVIDLYERFKDGPGAKEVQNKCVTVLLDLLVANGHKESRQILDAIADDALGHLGPGLHLVPAFRNVLLEGPLDGSDPAVEEARQRSMDFLLRITRSAARSFRSGLGISGEGQRGGAEEETPSEEDMKALADLLHSVGMNLYFAARKEAGDDEDPAPPGREVLARLLREAGQIIDELARVGLPQVTHHLLETLEVMVPFDPKGVFLRIAAAVRGGQEGGYEYDRMAEDVLVRIVEVFLADHRSVLQDDEEVRRALIEVLDTFVRAGSPGARQLSYGLEGIFR